MEVKINNRDILRAEITDNQLIFQDGLAIANIRISAKDFYNERLDYSVVSVVKEKEEGKENEPYELAGDGANYFSGQRYVRNITRKGSDFILEIITGEENVSWSVYKHFRAREVTKGMYAFDFVRKLPCRLILTSHDNIGFLKPDLGKMSLYNINEGNQGKYSYSSIEEARDGLFLVVDTICSTMNPHIKDRFVFLIDEDENIIGDILSRNNKMEPYSINEGEIYTDVFNRRTQELNEIAYTEENAIQKLKLGNN